ncbi:MAG: c-type cytochrome [Sandaracinaceae bacterium]
MVRFLRWAGLAVGGLLLAGALAFGAAVWTASAKRSRTLSAHTAAFPIPFPLTAAEAAELRAEQLGGVDLEAAALERAVERGRHLVEARYACVECHGRDLSGGTMVDDPMIGSLLGPNLTSGQGGKVGAYDAADWDRAVRHGILPDGRPSWMPAEDYQRMSDQELSDIVAYLRTFPAVDKEVPPPSLGPVGYLLVATGQLPMSADVVPDHHAQHARLPPDAAPTEAFGAHLVGICTGCHRADLAGGPIPGGPPDWLPAANLTPHAEGLAGWSYDDFVVAMRDMRRPDGTGIGAPMTLMQPYARRMTDVELQALWAYLTRTDERPTHR